MRTSKRLQNSGMRLTDGRSYDFIFLELIDKLIVRIIQLQLVLLLSRKTSEFPS